MHVVPVVVEDARVGCGDVAGDRDAGWTGGATGRVDDYLDASGGC